MHSEHKILLARLREKKRPAKGHWENDSYLSSGHTYYNVPVPVRRAIAKDWLKKNREVDGRGFAALLDSLFRGKSHEEKTLASLLLGYNKRARQTIGPKELDAWLEHLTGWAEIDALCSNVYAPGEMLADFPRWERFLRRLACDKNINRRRAALVFLTGVVRRSGDERLRALAFEIVGTLAPEREIIITKAVSWLLRSLVAFHCREVARFITEHKTTLPSVAVRETLRKIKTGRK